MNDSPGRIPIREKMSSGMHRSAWALLMLAVCVSLFPRGRIIRAQAVLPVVHAVLFHSPMCSFCSEIIGEDLPPRIDQYGSQLVILNVNIQTAAGMALYQAGLETYHVTGGIPVLFVGDIVLKGEAIPERLPGLVDSFLAQSGLDWPKIPGLEEYRRSLQAATTPSPTAAPPPATPTFAAAPSAQANKGADGPIVRALLFFSPTCSHCRFVQSEILPAIQERFGDRLKILSVDTHTEEGYDLYKSAASLFGLEGAGVPFLVIGNQYLLGSDQIEEFLTPLIEQALAQGGVDWPAVPGLDEFLYAESPAPAGTESDVGFLALIQANIRRDPIGNAASIVVLLGMLYVGAAAAVRFPELTDRAASRIPEWVTPVICLMGLGIAGYLSYVEVGRVEAFCGPVGDCNTVQQSPFARLFGIFPIGVLGVIGYLLILAAWIPGKAGKGGWTVPSGLAVLGLSALGFLFSIYLTFLEPFVIGASCSWCLASAILMTALFRLSLLPGKTAICALLPGSD
jgi:uncharacterized membrane protein